MIGVEVKLSLPDLDTPENLVRALQELTRCLQELKRLAHSLITRE